MFDSLAHPTLTGNWLGKPKYQGKSSFAALDASLQNNDFMGACAVGMADVEAYEHEAFFQACQPYDMLYPVAGFNPNKTDNPYQALSQLKEMGFQAIKIHPRFSQLDITNNSLIPTFQAAAQLELIIFYCTYQHCGIEKYPISDPFHHLIRLLKSTPKAKVILMHGGDVQVLRYAELVRFNPNLLLDLSLTMCKYEGSSIDLDLQFLFAHFDRRICIGSDFPEYTHDHLRSRFSFFSNSISQEKRENIAFRNLCVFLQIM